MVADTIRNEYYYDESAGIRQCLTKVLGIANKRLTHQRDRYGMGHGDESGPDRRRGRRGAWPRAVRRDRRPRRGLPDPPGPPVDPARTPTASAACPPRSSCPRSGAASSTSVTRSASSRRTSSPASGPTPSRTPWSRSIPSPRSSTCTRGSSRRTARAATARSRSRRPRSARPTRPSPSSRSGPPSRSPGHPTAVRSRSPTRPSAPPRPWAPARRGRGTPPGNGFQRSVWRIQDLLPRRRQGSRKVTAATTPDGDAAPGGRRPAGVHRGRRRARPRRVRRRRPAVSPTSRSASLTVAQAAFSEASEAVERGERQRRRPDPRRPAPGPRAAQRRLPKLDEARGGGLPGRPRSTRCAKRSRPASTGCTASCSSAPATCSSSRPTSPSSSTALVRGSDGAPYVLDEADKTVWRIDLAEKTAPADREVRATACRASGSPTRRSSPSAAPTSWSSTTKNSLWRWRPVGHQGQGDAGPDPDRGREPRGATTSTSCRRSSRTSTPRSTSSTSSTRRSRTSWCCRRRTTARATRSSPSTGCRPTGPSTGSPT